MPHPPVLLASLAVPLLAAGAAAAAVALPLLVHLLTRQRHQVVEWAATRFLRVTEKTARRRVDRWLLLAVRTLLLLLLVAGLAADTPWAERVWQAVRPAPAQAAADAPRTHHVVVLDATLSMAAARPDGRTRFEAAVQLAEQAVRAANPGDGWTLIGVGTAAEAVVPGPAGEPDKVLAELATVRQTHAATDLAAGLGLAADALARSPRAFPRRQVLVVTDLQKAAWAGLLAKPDGGPPDLWQRLLPRADVAVLDAAGGEVDNLAVTDLLLADPLALADAPAAVTAAVQNFGRTDKKQVRLELLVGRPGPPGADVPLLPVEQRVLPEVRAGDRVTVPFALEAAGRFREPGPHLLQVRLLDGDDLPADDRRTLAVTVRGGLAAVVVGQPAAQPLRGTSGYLLEALAPRGRTGPGNPARPKPLTRTEFADPTLGDLSAAHAAFLCDVSPPTPAELARLDALLRRGGGVVVGLGPTAAGNLDGWNRLLFGDGAPVLPGKLVGVAGSGAPDAPGFRLAAADDAYRLPPLLAFADDNARAGLTSAPFRKYLRLDAPADGPSRRVLQFVPADVQPDAATRPDPAVVEVPRHRGKLVVYTSSFSGDWTDWPVLPSFLPFAHELLRHVTGNPDPHTVRVGEPLEAAQPAAVVGLTARLVGPDGATADAPVAADADAGTVRFADTGLSGLYRVAVPGRPDQTFAVNPQGAESDLRRLDPAEFKAIGPVAVVTDPADAPATGDEAGPAVLAPRPHGPTVARWLLAAAFLVVLLESYLAWRVGPARTRAGGPADPAPWRPLGLVVAVVPLLVAAGLLGVLLHADLSGDLLGFVPTELRSRLEAAAGVPPATAGEGVRWRLESRPAFRPSLLADRWVLALLAVSGVGLVAGLYRLERRAAGRWGRVLVPLLLRTAAVLLLLFVLLPQVRLAFDREGFPDVAVLLDTSASMATADGPAAGDTGPAPTSRIDLAKALLARGDGDLVGRLLLDRRVRVHVYSLADRVAGAAVANDPGDLPAARAAMQALPADGEGSRLGDGVQQVLKAFRGGSLAGLVVLSDGVTTAGDDLPAAGKAAARAGVPLFVVGFGQARESQDVALSDVKSDEAVVKGDELVMEARLTARGGSPEPVPVVLYERQGEKLLKRAETTVKPDPAGKPVPVRLVHTPTEPGEKTFVLDVPVRPGEADPGNNRAERVVLVTESRRLRVLYVEGYPRYEFRFVKALLERETETAGGRAVELSTLLLDASTGYAEQDRSAVRGLPTRAELFEFDLVVLGDVDPATVPRAQGAFADLLEFVKVRGGGLMFVAGPQSNPAKLFATPLADVLPVVPSEASGPPPEPAAYHPQLTPLGRSHPLFRFAPDEAENARVWAGLRPLQWFATGYRRKLSAEVLAVHPDRPAEGGGGENHPLVLQQFAGAGRVLFVGFDDSWRWRFRAGEERFNQYWRQAGRVLARSRPSRTELRTDKQTPYRRDEPIRLTVRFPDDAPAPPPEAVVKVAVDRTAGGVPADPQAVQLAKVEGTRATFQTLLTRTPEGDYRFRLTEPVPAGTPPRAEAKVLPPAGERDRLDPDVPAMTRAASDGQGKFYRPGEADKLLDDLPEAARVPLNQPVPPVPVWNQAAMFAAVAALLVAEWVLRRRERLV